VKTRFGPFTVDSRTRQLLRDGRDLHLSPKAFDLLCALLERRPDVVRKDDLHARIWPNTYVVDANLNVLIGEIRRALGDQALRPQFIRTAHGVGYAFCGEAAEVEPAAARAVAPRVWLVWKDRTFLLADGDNVIGRDPQCGIWLDASGVSRQHASIRVDAANRSASLHDLDSTNGTFLGGAAVVEPTRLADGDVITIGAVELTFRAWTADTAQKTERIRRRTRDS
jgi:DNA-binding winged helix-turn-helix (wHTH) protein